MVYKTKRRLLSERSRVSCVTLTLSMASPRAKEDVEHFESLQGFEASSGSDMKVKNAGAKFPGLLSWLICSTVS